MVGRYISYYFEKLFCAKMSHVQLAQIDGNIKKTLANFQRVCLKVIHNFKAKNLIKSSYTLSYSRYPQKIHGINSVKRVEKRTTVL